MKVWRLKMAFRSTFSWILANEPLPKLSLGDYNNSDTPRNQENSVKLVCTHKARSACSVLVHQAPSCWIGPVMNVLWLQPPTDWSIESHQIPVYYTCKYRKWLQRLHTHAAPPRGRQVKAPPTKHDNAGAICMHTVFIWVSDLSSSQRVCVLFRVSCPCIHTHTHTRSTHSFPPRTMWSLHMAARVCVCDSDASGLRGILMTFIRHRTEHANLPILHSHTSRSLNFS